MKTRLFLSLLALTSLSSAGLRAETFDEAAAGATTQYAERLRVASDQLTKVREQIASEKAPQLKALHAAEERIIAAETEITQLETGQEQSLEKRRQLQKEFDTLRKNLGYVATLAHDSSTALRDSLAPGEEQLLQERLLALQQKFDDPAAALTSAPTVAAAELLLQRVEQTLGGYTTAGKAILAGKNEVVEGTFAFVGPETFFRTLDGRSAGTVRTREGSIYPIYYPLSDWKPAEAEAFFQGKPGTIMADMSGGKALRLKETKGTLWQHVNKGGIVSYAILCVGLLSLLLIINKVRDLTKLGVDEPETVHQFLSKLSSGARSETQHALGTLRSATAELFTTGLRFMDEPKTVLEEHMWAILLRQRLHYERRLPLLAVIAVAAPLMGLLGTVTGMVKTFALITVFGTGNAGKLASGISEVLVSTELGLIVAIPTLVAHGFLANRIQKKLSLLERYTLEFVTAAQPHASKSTVANSAKEPAVAT
jgi:biopolymer transport protein ExbB